MFDQQMVSVPRWDHHMLKYMFFCRLTHHENWIMRGEEMGRKGGKPYSQVCIQQQALPIWPFQLSCPVQAWMFLSGRFSLSFLPRVSREMGFISVEICVKYPQTYLLDDSRTLIRLAYLTIQSAGNWGSFCSGLTFGPMIEFWPSFVTPRDASL